MNSAEANFHRVEAKLNSAQAIFHRVEAKRDYAQAKYNYVEAKFFKRMEKESAPFLAERF